jgi:large subunit ribosomal protein L28
MGRQCEICGKGTATGFSVSFSHRRTKRVYRANLQRIRGVVDGRLRRVVVCTSCLKSGRVRRAG